jgi:hypothetical protein
MLGLRHRGTARHWVADFALALVLFWVAALALGAAHSHAYAVSLPVLVRQVLVRQAIVPDAAPSSPARLGPNELGRTASIHEKSPEHARLLLSLALATLAAINLGLWRHLRRVYASPRRRVWRRG